MNYNDDLIKEIQSCTSKAQLLKILKKYNVEIAKNDSIEVGCFSVWLDSQTRVYQPKKRSKMIFQRWQKIKLNYSGIPVFFG